MSSATAHDSPPAPLPPPAWLCWQELEHIDAAVAPTREQFVESWGKPGKPVKLDGLTANWSARTRWTFDFFAQRYGDCMVMVGRRSTPDTVQPMRLADYIATIRTTAMADPYYLKDWVFRAQAPELYEDFSAPPQFPCYFAELDPELQPGFSWIYIGPRHSTSNFHRDVAATSAWNALIGGRKLWLFFAPDRHAEMYHNDLDAFAECDAIDPLLRHTRPLYCIQEPGEVVFTPSLWWHQVYNLEPSIAVTENFVDDCNLHAVLKGLRASPERRHTALALALLVGSRRLRKLGAGL